MSARNYQLDIEPHILERGMRYWAQGKIIDTGPIPNGGLYAEIKGTRVYEVLLEVWNRHGQITLDGVCNCPYNDVCKHIGALFVEFMNRADTGDGDHMLSQYLDSLAVLSEPVQVADDGPRLQLKMIRSVEPKLDFEHIVSLQIVSYTQRLGKSGKWVKPRLTRFSYGYIEDSDLSAEHLALLQWLITIKPEYSDKKEIELQPIVTGEFLRQAITAGVLFDAEIDAPLNLGETRSLAIHWLSERRGHVLSWQLAGEDLGEALQLVNAGKRFWYCDVEKGALGEVECAFSPEKVAATGRLPVLNNEQRERVELTIAEQFSEPTVLALSSISSAPEKRLKMRGKVLRVDADGEAFEPHWAYGRDVIVQANPECERSYLSDKKYWLLRDIEQEADALLELSEMLGIDIASRNSRGDLQLPVGGRFNWPGFSLEAVPELEDAGWQVELPDHLQFKFHDISKLSVEMEEGAEGGWWFEVGFSLESDGHKLELVPILADWIANHGLGEGPLQGLSDEEFYPLVVDVEGRVWRVPVSVLRTLIHQFADLIDSGKSDRLKLPRAALAHLDTVLEDVPTRPWKPPAKLKKLAKNLRTSRELKPKAAPKGFGAQLRPYQESGVGWLQFLADTGMNGILADDMGLGKTVQTLAHICHLRKAKPKAAPVLVVAPTSVVGNWRRETDKFAPKLKHVTLYGPTRKQWFERLDEFDIVFTSYALLQRDSEVLQAQPFSLVVLDEAQWIKNPRAKTAVAAKALQTERRLCLSGTPMENHTGELWSLFDFLMPGFLGSEKRFRTLFRTPIEKQSDGMALERLRNRTAPFILRRSKALVAADLPERNEMVQSVEMEPAQKAIYEAVRAQMEKKVRTALAAKGLGKSHIMVLEALLKLRQCCCDPRLLPSRTKGRARAKSAKLELLMELLPTLIEDGRRILLFSQFTSMLDLIAEELKQANISYLSLTGRSRNRDALVDSFQAGEADVFLISLKAGGVGLNLTAADTVIIYDPWWNPAVEQQAIDRAHRIGQDKSVFVYRMVTEGTIEEKILQLQEKKRLLTSGVMDGGDAVPSGLSEEQIFDFLKPL